MYYHHGLRYTYILYILVRDYRTDPTKTPMIVTDVHIAHSMI